MEAFFLPRASGRRFYLLHTPRKDVTPRGAIVYVHPFAEEMNKSRRMAALQCEALGQAGWFVLQPDLYGCGDSDGDLNEATWDLWVSDCVEACQWLHQRSGFAPCLWGLRAGCLLAAAAARELASKSDLVFWQPVSSGKQHLQQFLRMKQAGQMLAASKQAAGSTKQFSQQLAAGESLEIAGYLLSPALASGISSATLTPPIGPGRLCWFEIKGTADVDLSPAARADISAWEDAGWRVFAKAITGAPFWQTQEIEEVPELIQATVNILAQAA